MLVGTTDRLFVEKPHLYDVLIDLSTPPFITINPNPKPPPPTPPSTQFIMRLATGILAALSLTSFAAARIVSLKAPSTTITPGKPFSVTFTTESYSENTLDFYVIFGLKEASLGNSGIGSLLGTGYDIVSHGHSDDGHGTFKVSLEVPSTWKSNVSKWTLTAAVTTAVSYRFLRDLLVRAVTDLIHLLNTGGSLRRSIHPLLPSQRHHRAPQVNEPLTLVMVRSPSSLISIWSQKLIYLHSQFIPSVSGY